MRKLFILTGILLAILAMTAPMVSAQDGSSSGCSAISGAGGTAPATVSNTFAAGESISVTVTSGDGGTFDVTIAGSLVIDDGGTGSSATYQVLGNGSVSIEISVTNGSGSYSLNCSSDAPPAGSDGTICHRPPGNPDAAHTITVGIPAVETHLGHGDTLGPCPEGIQTRADLPDVNITIFVIFATDTIQVYGDCDDECEEVMNVPIVLLIDLDLVVINFGSDDDVDDDDSDDDSDPGEFMEVENPEDYGFVLDEVNQDGMYVVIYYLHPDPEDSSVGVFQINVYESNTLVDDSILVFITTGGDIVQWTDQGYWDEQLQESFEND